jgi:hypothetical protein
MWSGLQIGRSTAEDEHRLAEVTVQGDRMFPAVEGFRLCDGSLLDSPDPDASPPRWMETIDSMSPPRAFGFGMVLFPLQVKNLAIFVACLNLIIASSLSPRGSIVALILVLVVIAIPVLVLIGLICLCATSGFGSAGLLASVDGEEQPPGHGRNLPRVRSVLPGEGALGSVLAWKLCNGGYVGGR